MTKRLWFRLGWLALFVPSIIFIVFQSHYLFTSQESHSGEKPSLIYSVLEWYQPNATIVNIVFIPAYFQLLFFIHFALWLWILILYLLSSNTVIQPYKLLFDSSTGIIRKLTKSPSDDIPPSTLDSSLLNDKVKPSLQSGSLRALSFLAMSTSAITFFGFLVFQSKLAHRLNISTIEWKSIKETDRHALEYIVLYTFVGLLVFIFIPINVFWPKQRFYFIQSLKRIFFGGISTPTVFLDLVLADILTSFSRIMGDLGLVWMDLFFEPDAAAHSHSFIDMIAPVLVALPFLCRFRQCIADIKTTRSTQARWRHVLNAVKYLTSIPVIFFAFGIHWLRQSYHKAPDGLVQHVQHQFYGLIIAWIVTSLINTVFSLYWDIAMDWGLSLESSFGRPLLFPPWLYMFAIIFNTLARFLWIVKIPSYFTLVDLLLGHTHAISHQEKILLSFVVLDFVLKCIEILRRSIWIVFRMEREWLDQA